MWRPLVSLSLFVAVPLFASQADVSASLGIQNNRTPFVGAGLNFMLTVTNGGPDVATNTIATWTIPVDPGFDFDISRCTASGQHSITCKVGDLAAGSSMTFLAGLWIPAQPITVTASAFSAAGDPNPSNNTATMDVVPLSAPLIQASMAVSPLPAEGRPSDYTVTAVNAGGGPANDVRVRWTFAGDATIAPMGFCSRVDAKTVDCRTDVLQVNQQWFLRVIVTPGAAGGIIDATATLTYGGGAQPVTLTQRLRVAPNARLQTTSTPPSELDANGNMTFGFTVVNPSAADTHQLTATANFAGGSKLIGAIGADCRDTTLFGSSRTEVTCTLPDLAAGKSLDFSITVKPPQPQGLYNAFVRVGWEDPALQFASGAVASTVIYHDIFVTTTADSGPGSLRAAIDEGNVRGTYTFPCRVAFRIEGTPPFVIEPLTPLPAVTADYLSIDARTEKARVVIRGGKTFADGFFFAGSALTVAGLAIEDFPANGITAVPRARGTLRIIDNEISGNLRGVVMGGVTAELTGNTITHNVHSGVYMANGSVTLSKNTIRDNGNSGIYLGPDILGVEAADNEISGHPQFGIAIDRKARQVAIRVNSIHDNGIDAIDFGLDGPDDLRSPKPPQIVSATYADGKTTIRAKFDPRVALAKSFTILFFANRGLDAGGRAEAETFLGSAAGTNGEAELVVDRDLRGQIVTAMNVVYIDAYGESQWTESSELSDGVTVPIGSPLVGQ
jgi:hypothetical protein